MTTSAFIFYLYGGLISQFVDTSEALNPPSRDWVFDGTSFVHPTLYCSFVTLSSCTLSIIEA